MNARFAATPRNTNGMIVAIEDSMNIVLIVPEGGGERARVTVTDVDGLIAALRDAKIEREILEDLHRPPVVLTRAAYLLRKGDVMLVGADKRRLVVDHLVNLTNDVRVNGRWADDDGPDADFLARMGSLVEVTVPAFDSVEVYR